MSGVGPPPGFMISHELAELDHARVLLQHDLAPEDLGVKRARPRDLRTVMNRVMRKPSPGAGRFSKSMAGVCSLTVLRSSYASDGGWQPPGLKPTEIHRAAPNGASASDEKRRYRVLDE